jgi:hypothetical protein
MTLSIATAFEQVAYLTGTFAAAFAQPQFGLQRLDINGTLV